MKAVLEPNFTPDQERKRTERVQMMLDGRWEDYYADTRNEQWLDVLDSIARNRVAAVRRRAA